MERPENVRTPQESVFFLIHSVSLKITRLLYNRVIKDSGLTMQEWRVLQVIAFDYPCLARHVSDVSGIHQAHVSVTIKKLIQKGMIQRTQSTADARQKELSPTTLGSECVKELFPKAGAVARKVWLKMPDSDFQYARDMLKKMEAIIESMS